MEDTTNPKHYKEHPSGIECITITENMGFCLGNALKYIWRVDLKHNDGGIEDLRKARWYIDKEIEKRMNKNEIKIPRNNNRQREEQDNDASGYGPIKRVLPERY
jgi:hypothetical protein